MERFNWQAAILVLLCTVLAAVSSVPLLPPGPTPLIISPLTANLSAITSGLQVLLPGHQFQEVGTVDRITLRVQGLNSAIALQIWRPVEGGEERKYHLHWYGTFTEDTVMTRRKDVLMYRDPVGVPVKVGDVMGYFIPSSSEESISVPYYQSQESLSDATAALFYMESVGEGPFCDVVLCNTSWRTVAGAIPFIQTHLVPSSETSETLEEDHPKLLQHQQSSRCTENPALTCTSPTSHDDSLPVEPVPVPARLTKEEAQNSERATSEVTTEVAMPTSKEATAKVTTEMVAPSPSITTILPVDGGDTQDATHVILPREEASLLSTEDVDTVTDDSNDGPAISTAAIAFIIVGGVFFVVLVILLFVLFACLFPRNSVKKTFVPVTAGESGNSSNSNLVSSSSVEHSNNSNTPGYPETTNYSNGTHIYEHPGTSTGASPDNNSRANSHHQLPCSNSTNHICNNNHSNSAHTTHQQSRVNNGHTYANAGVSRLGEFRPFTPLYMNSDESLRELLSDKGSHHGSRVREERGWSVESSYRDRVQHKRDGRSWSAGPSQLERVNKKHQQRHPDREVRGSSVDPARLHRTRNHGKEGRGKPAAQVDDVHHQHVREGRGMSVGPAAKAERVQHQQKRNKRGTSAGPAQVDRVNHVRKKSLFGGRGGEKKQNQLLPKEEKLSPVEPHPRALHEDKVPIQQEAPRREDRAKSVSATSRFKVHHEEAEIPRARSYTSNLSTTVLSKPLPLPPFSVPPPLIRRSSSQHAPGLIPPPTHSPPPPRMSTDLAPNHSHLSNEASGDYSSPVPVSERYKYDPRLRFELAEVTSMQGQPFCVNQSHDYSDPDEPEDDEVPLGTRYDHLSPIEPDVHPETHAQAFLDLEGLKDENVTNSEYHKGYVPTEDQRRLMQLQCGDHYEIADDLETKPVKGYDHLNFFQESDIYWAPAATAEDLYTQLSDYKYREIERKEISILKSIGSGHFGTVRKGVWFTNNTSVQVAIKSVKNSMGQERVKLLQEAAIMGQFAHSSVVRLLGVVTVGEPVLVILEYMQKGDLHSFLQKLHPKVSNRELPSIVPTMFVKFSQDIANGMTYLAKKCFIHRDLAARNILLNNELTCKIGDFGMARDIESEGDYYKSHGGIIPVKWTAPEALHYNKYSSASDVWSYGMVLFEIWSLGEKPFNELSNPIVIALVSSKHCQPPPPGCPRPIYHLMVECWNPDHNQRPTFDSIYGYLESPEESLLQWNDKDIDPDRLAHVLGSPLEEANNLYLDLQRIYQKPLV